MAPRAAGAYSQAIMTDDFVFLSGQGPIDPETNAAVEGDMSVQVERVLQNLGAVLSAAGLDFSDVVKTTCFLRDMNDFAAFNAVYARYFSEPYPARSTIEAGRLPLDFDVEIECIARRR
jgi:2-iminobutanoate/2-iminopropanoate deaminase